MKTKQFMPASSSKGVPVVQRRALLQGAAALACGAAAPGVSGALAAPARVQAAQSAAPLIARDGDAVVATRAGRVAGYIRNGIFTFKGIPYADDCAGPNRFMPPVKPKSWEGVRSSRQYGYVAPQGPRAGWANDEEAFMFAWDDGVQSEDCLRVNVWTPAVGDGKKRPVMVWLHGGGYTAGSGQELRSYDGENVARRGDVVVVSLNHRLNVSATWICRNSAISMRRQAMSACSTSWPRLSGCATTSKISGAIQGWSRFSASPEGAGR